MATISKATEYNWKKLNSNPKEKLAKRANKTQSKKRVVATSYLDFAPANQLLANVQTLDNAIEDIIYSLCVLYLKHSNIFDKDNVKAFFATLSCYNMIDIDTPLGIWDSDVDVLGFIYQSLITEGERNLTGQYYTNREVVEYIINGKILKDGETFLDPCCGSGAFLLAVTTNTPSCLYGFDINPIAVMMAGTNLLAKYSNDDFVPNVYCLDFLQKDFWGTSNRVNLPFKFDNIYTNPPWGIDRKRTYINDYPEIKSKERSSMVIVESLKRLNNRGDAYFLLPTSLLKIDTHNDVRKYILSNSSIKRIDLFSERFDGVFTDFFSIKLAGVKTDCHNYEVTTKNGATRVSLSMTDKSAGNIVIEHLSDVDDSIIQKIEACRHDDLKHSQWALGIVTGDNKSKVKKEKSSGLEPVYTGKQVSPFKLQKESSYILFVPETFQQSAKEEFYRAPEKLIYRFIAKYPIVAYDDKRCLCLNSANILIPELDSISIKSAAALLNSALYHYYYSIKFTDIKVLKRNLQELPFPKLSKSQDDTLSNLVSAIQISGYSEEYQRMLDEMVYSLFGITPTEQNQIEARVR